MIHNLFICLWITIGITFLIGIIGLILSILGNTSRKYLQILGEFIYIWNILHSGLLSYNPHFIITYGTSR